MELTNYLSVVGMGLGSASIFFVLALIWSAAWKGFGLWHAAKRSEMWWFIAFLLVNTLGVLEIIYMLFIARVPELRRWLGFKSVKEGVNSSLSH